MNKKIKILLSIAIVSLSALIVTAKLPTNKIIVANALSKDADQKKYHDGWIMADCVNIRENPSTKSKVLGRVYFNEKISFYYVNKNWARILCKEDIGGYVHRKYISNEKPIYKMYNVPYTNGKKTYMPYKVHKNGKYQSVFSISSKQYRLQQYCYTGDYGIRQFKKRFCVALGSGFGVLIGQYFDLYLANGELIQCIMADQKADVHTDASNIVTLHSGCMSEFIVDNTKLNSLARRMGDISYCNDLWQSRVIKVKVYKKHVEL